ncbi:hypothetical protein QQP08_002219 [Theobroma cacao]|nr:hypothetical protein QQP08_002219 [Theobroma cacao]
MKTTCKVFVFCLARNSCSEAPQGIVREIDLCCSALDPWLTRTLAFLSLTRAVFQEPFLDWTAKMKSVLNFPGSKTTSLTFHWFE